MENLQLEKTSKTPAVSFDAEKGKLEIEGRSKPDNAKEFYIPLVKWIERYSQYPKDKTQVTLYYTYYNTATAKYILDILRNIDDLLYKKGHQVSIQWQYDDDDEDVEMDGKDYNEMVSVPVEVVAVRSSGQ